MHGVAPQMCGRVASPLLGRGAGGRSRDDQTEDGVCYEPSIEFALTFRRYPPPFPTRPSFVIKGGHPILTRCSLSDLCNWDVLVGPWLLFAFHKPTAIFESLKKGTSLRDRLQALTALSPPGLRDSQVEATPGIEASPRPPDPRSLVH